MSRIDTIPGLASVKMGMDGNRLQVLSIGAECVALRINLPSIFPLATSKGIIFIREMSTEALSLFRAALRTSRTLPRLVSKKFTYNLREMYELYRGSKDASKLAHVIREGWHDVGVMRELMQTDAAVREEIFRNFESIGMHTTSSKVEKSAEDMIMVHKDGVKRVGPAEILLPHADLDAIQHIDPYNVEEEEPVLMQSSA